LSKREREKERKREREKERKREREKERKREREKERKRESDMTVRPMRFLSALLKQAPKPGESHSIG
jgi:hypothetical protein